MYRVSFIQRQKGRGNKNPLHLYVRPTFPITAGNVRCKIGFITPRPQTKGKIINLSDFKINSVIQKRKGKEKRKETDGIQINVTEPNHGARETTRRNATHDTVYLTLMRGHKKAEGEN